MIVFTIAFSLMAQKHNTNLRYREAIDGIVLDLEDVARIIKSSGNAAKLKAGSYEVGIVMPYTPAFHLGNMYIEIDEFAKPRPRMVRRLEWNNTFDIAEERYMKVPSMPDFEWARYPLRSHAPYKIVFYDNDARHIQMVLEIEGVIKRDNAIAAL
jgi:hypothetical protein